MCLRGKREIQIEFLFSDMDLLEWTRSIIREYPLTSLLSVFSPVALIGIRKFYLEYFSDIRVEIVKVSISSRAANYNVPNGSYYFKVQTKISRKTRKDVFLEPVECRILTDSISTKWYNDNWAKGNHKLTDSSTKMIDCNFFESQGYNIYQFEVRFQEDGTKNTWVRKSNKFQIVNSQLIASK
tara:strand:- start:1328 stop:1876 length:549 start_codon:yes stop_codon:yes gene_type:complete